jgi:hypothetical protein
MTNECAWCKREYEIATYPVVESFILSFEEGTTSEDTGPNLMGYELENLCVECARKLKDELIKLGIEINEIEI